VDLVPQEPPQGIPLPNQAPQTSLTESVNYPQAILLSQEPPPVSIEQARDCKVGQEGRPQVASQAQDSKFRYEILVIVALFVLPFLAIVCFILGTNENGLGVAGFVMIVLTLFPVALTQVGVRQSCPACHRWWARTPRGNELIDKKQVYKTVERTDEHAGSIFGKSALFGTSGVTKRKEQVKVLRQTFRHFYECTYCGHGWHFDRVKESEDFDLDEGR
jgi:hypothetical protein